MEKQQCSASGLSRGELKTLGLSSLGGILEFYDFIIVFFFAKIISQHFFPAGIGEFWAMLNTYGTFAAGYLARPLGGVVMAHFGDKFGRKNMFMLSIALMVIPDLLARGNSYVRNDRLCCSALFDSRSNLPGHRDRRRTAGRLGLHS